MQIFIGNLAYSTTHQGLRQAFEAYGTVEGVSIPLDWATGGSRGGSVSKVEMAIFTPPVQRHSG